MHNSPSPENYQPLTKAAVIADPLALSRCFQQHAAPHLTTERRNPAWIEAIITAETECDNILKSLNISELFHVYAHYLEHQPEGRAPFKDDKGKIFDGCKRSARDDYYSMGLRELQSVACHRPDVNPHVEYSVIMSGPLGIEDRRIQHLVGATYGGYPRNVYYALEKALNSPPAAP